VREDNSLTKEQKKNSNDTNRANESSSCKSQS